MTPDCALTIKFTGYRLSEIWLVFVMCLPLWGLGCQHYSPTHSSGNPWLLERPMSQVTNTLEFQYVGYTESGMESGVKGEAIIQAGLLPEWVAYYEQATVMVYVTDQRGRIVEQHRQDYQQGKKVAEPLYFDFKLDSPVRLDDRTFYISFGYFLELSEFDPISEQSGRKIIRHEAGYK